MQKFNYHTHTKRCGHASNMEDEEYILEFISKGFNEIAFTDHCPYRDIIDTRKNMRMNYSNKDEYLNSIRSLKIKYKDKINIKIGFEVEYLPDQVDYLLELKNETDILVLGQHFIYDETKKLKIFRYDNFSDNDLIKYANYIEKAIKNNIPDIIVHPDLFMLNRTKFGLNEEKATRIICKSASENNIPLEINLTEACLFLRGDKDNISYLCKDFWRIASTYNLRVLYGIDAHFRSQIELYEKSVELVNNIIVKDIIDKLNFVDNL